MRKFYTYFLIFSIGFLISGCEKPTVPPRQIYSCYITFYSKTKTAYTYSGTFGNSTTVQYAIGATDSSNGNPKTDSTIISLTDINASSGTNLSEQVTNYSGTPIKIGIYKGSGKGNPGEFILENKSFGNVQSTEVDYTVP